MWNLDPYLQTSWQLTSALTLDAGVRFSTVNFDDNDFYVRPGNGDDSGEARYHRWLPAASLKYALTDSWNIYASAGRGFETPTINELSYRADDQGGLNNRLQPSTSDTLEIGSKTRIGNGLLSAALFQTDTKNEIVVDSSSGGRSSYKTPDRHAAAGWSWRSINSLLTTGGCVWHGRCSTRPTATASAAIRHAVLKNRCRAATGCRASRAIWRRRR